MNADDVSSIFRTLIKSSFKSLSKAFFKEFSILYTKDKPISTSLEYIKDIITFIIIVLNQVT